MTETSDVWTGKASSYDRVRPTPPPALLDLLTQLIQMPHPAYSHQLKAHSTAWASNS